MNNRSIMQPRQTARISAKNLLEGFNASLHSWFKNEARIKQAFEMIEREIGGYLSNPGSAYYNIANQARCLYFRSGIVFRAPLVNPQLIRHYPIGVKNEPQGLGPGRDLLLVFNIISSKKRIFKNLSNLEYGVYNILGYHLSMALFQLRGDLLKELYRFETYHRKVILIRETIKAIQINSDNYDLLMANFDQDQSFIIHKILPSPDKKSNDHTTVTELLDAIVIRKKSQTCLKKFFDKLITNPDYEARLIRENLFASLRAIESVLKKFFSVEYNKTSATMGHLDVPSWFDNVIANKAAMNRLQEKISKEPPPLKNSEISLSRWGLLSCFHSEKNPFYTGIDKISIPKKLKNR